MREPPYTAHDTPAGVARIRSDLGRITARLRSADPRLKAVVLTGGFARGEGAVLDGAPQNDYDLVALRAPGTARVPYPAITAGLERELGLHVDLAPVGTWRLRFVAPTIFWYETALCGRTLWGVDLLPRIPVRDPARLARTEGIRLLVNRAAGLLLVTMETHGARQPAAYRLQAAKAFLAAMDVELLARGAFPPTQRDRYNQFSAWRRTGHDPEGLRPFGAWLEWAMKYKLDPARAAACAPDEAWAEARAAILVAVGTAIRHAGFHALEDCSSRDGWIDRLYYSQRARRVPGARRFAWHPTGRVRVATLRLLEAAHNGVVPREAAIRHLAPLARVDQRRPLVTLAALRRATPQ